MNAGDVPTYICTYIIGRRYKVREVKQAQGRHKLVKKRLKKHKIFRSGAGTGADGFRPEQDLKQRRSQFFFILERLRGQIKNTPVSKNSLDFDSIF